MSAVDEFSAVGLAATGTAGLSRQAENGGAGEVNPTADPMFCERCQMVHQERERKVLCLRCRRHGTSRVHAICEICEPGGHIT